MRKNGVKTVKVKPDLAVLWNNKGAEFFRLERYDQAWYNLASVCVAEGKKEEALSKLKKAIETDPDIKKTVKEANCFKALWKNRDFKRLIAN